MKKNLRYDNPEVIDAFVARIDRMTPEEVMEFLMRRTPGIEETDMTGMFADLMPNQEQVSAAA